MYATALTPGPVKLRPWQLGYRADFGFASMAEPEDMETLIRLIGSEGFGAQRRRFAMFLSCEKRIMSESVVTLLVQLFLWQRMRTDSDRLHGVERLAVTLPDPKMLEFAYSPLQPLSNHSLGLNASWCCLQFCKRRMIIITELCNSGDLLPPFSIGYIKGWRRSTAFLCIMAGIKLLEIDMAEVPDAFKACSSYRHVDIWHNSLMPILLGIWWWFFLCSLLLAIYLVPGDGSYSVRNSGAVYYRQGANFCIQRNHFGVNYDAAQPELLRTVETSQCACQDWWRQCWAAIGRLLPNIPAWPKKS